jgi:hypothetical protein
MIAYECLKCTTVVENADIDIFVIPDGNRSHVGLCTEYGNCPV